MKLVLPFLETMLTQACNLSCTGCTNYSDLRYSGYVKWADGKRDLEQWLDRIDIPDFGLMGGEPLMNPEVNELFLLAAIFSYGPLPLFGHGLGSLNTIVRKGGL